MTSRPGSNIARVVIVLSEDEDDAALGNHSNILQTVIVISDDSDDGDDVATDDSPRCAICHRTAQEIKSRDLTGPLVALRKTLEYTDEKLNGVDRSELNNEARRLLTESRYRNEKLREVIEAQDIHNNNGVRYTAQSLRTILLAQHHMGAAVRIPYSDRQQANKWIAAVLSRGYAAFNPGFLQSNEINPVAHPAADQDAADDAADRNQNLPPVVQPSQPQLDVNPNHMAVDLPSMGSDQDHQRQTTAAPLEQTLTHPTHPDDYDNHEVRSETAGRRCR